MSRWSRWKKRLFGEGDASEGVGPAPEARLAADGVVVPAQLPPAAPDTAARVLEDATRGDAAADAGALVAAVDALARRGRELEALRLGRRALLVHPQADVLAVRLAEIAAGRGDDALAAALLEPLLQGPASPLAALVLAGELAERRGDPREALAAYERALARDIDLPRARERAARLREGQSGARTREGATLLADGALARGRYRVLRELGRGGAGTVFAVRDTHTERVIALKLYLGRGPLERARLRGEACFAASLAHPGVVRIFDLDESLLAIAMEHVAEGSVRDALRRGSIPFQRAHRWLSSAADALSFVHAAGVVHRDLKPSNWLVRADDSVVLTDFGLARRIGEKPVAAEGAPQQGEGTLAYMPPEQHAGLAVAPSADVHALGATMRELLAATDGAVPAELRALAEACTSPAPDARPSLDAVRAALRVAAR